MFLLRDNLVDCSSGPIQESSRPDSYRVLTDGTKKTLVCLPVLLNPPLCFWKRYRPNQINQQSAYGQKQCNNKDVFEVSGREVLMDDEAYFDKYSPYECKKEGEIDA